MTLTDEQARALTMLTHQRSICEREDVIGLFTKAGLFTVCSKDGLLDLADKIEAVGGKPLFGWREEDGFTYPGAEPR